MKKLIPFVLIFRLKAVSTSPIFAELLFVLLNTLFIKLIGPSSGSVPRIHVSQIRYTINGIMLPIIRTLNISLESFFK